MMQIEKVIIVTKILTEHFPHEEGPELLHLVEVAQKIVEALEKAETVRVN